jgi:hypothetical protein
MRQTILLRDPSERLTLRTDDYGTTATGADGRIVEEYGTDRHAEALARWRSEGWRIAADGNIRPDIAGPPDGGAPGIADAPGPAGTVTDGESG